MKKLAEFAEQLDTNKNDNYNILNNLCTGLETFLGFNSTSNGYDGTGIVYSDLDRLCDAVMGFLSGVLEGVKDENEVTTYDNYITPDNKKLNEVLDTLTKNIGTGRAGLAASVAEVKEWLEGWEGEVKEKTENVKNELTWLVNNLSGNYKNKINENSSLTDQLSAWSEIIGHIYFDVTKIEEEKISKLDKALKTNVMNEINIVKKSVEMLKISGKNADVKGYVKSVDAELIRQEMKIKSKLANEVQSLKTKLAEELKHVIKKVYLLSENKKKHFTHMNNAITKANNELIGERKEAFDGTYKEKIIKHFEGAREVIQKVYTDLNIRKSELDDLLGQARLTLSKLSVDDAIEIRRAFKGDLEHLRMEIGKLNEEVTEKTDSSLVRDELVVLESANKKINDVTGPRRIYDNSSENLEHKFHTQITDKLSGLISGVERAIYNLYKSIDKSPQATVSVGDSSKGIADIMKHIKGQVETIKGSPGKGLQGFVDHVRDTYATAFVKGGRPGFSGVVDRWLDEILGLNRKEGMDAVTSWITIYVKEKQVTQGSVDEGKVKEQMKNQIKESIINNAIDTAQKAISNVTTDIATNVQYVKQVCESFATQLEQRIKEAQKDVGSATFKGILALAYGISTEIEGRFHLPNYTSDDKQQLTAAIIAAIVAVQSRARQVANELGSFTGLENLPQNSEIHKVDTAYNNAVSLDTNLNTAAGTNSTYSSTGTAKTVDNWLKRVSDDVNKLDEMFKENVKNGLAKVIADYNNAAKTQIQTAAYVGIGAAYDKVQKAHDRVDQDEFDNTNVGKAVKEYKQSVTHLENVLKQNRAIDQRMKQITTLLVQLNDISTNNGIIDGKKNAAAEIMENLFNALEKGLYEINVEISSTEKTLDDAIEHIYSAIKSAHDGYKRVISEFHGILLRELTIGFATLTNQVRTLFADAHKADLAALKTLVDGQKAEIAKIIFTNNMSGIKGLINSISSNLEKCIDPLMYMKFTKLSNDFKYFLHPIFKYIKNQATDSINASVKESNDKSKKFDEIHLYVTNLLDYLNDDKATSNPRDKIHKRVYMLDEHFDYLLDQLKSTLNNFAPSSFATSPSPLLAPLKAGLSEFAQQLGHAYVNRYSGVKFQGELTVTKTVTDNTKPAPGTTTTVTDLTPEGRNCAKVCLTIVEILGHDLGELRDKCEREWKKEAICLIKSDTNRNELGRFLRNCGFGVPSKHGLQDSELKWKEEWTGNKILNDCLIKAITSAKNNEHLKKCTADTSKDPAEEKSKLLVFDVLDCLMSHLKEYYRVGHLGTLNAKKHPLSIYDMLQWLTGIPNNPVYVDLSADGFDSLFDKPKADSTDTEDGDITVDLGVESLHTYKETITPASLSGALTEVCAQSHSVLTAVLGHGHAGGRYACEFNTNADGFMYPGDMNALICMVFEIAKRLHHQLYFLYRQCHDGTDLSGWSDCWYGNSIAGSSWKCNTIQCPNQTDNQKHNQSCDQKCNQTANCGLKSPLQSFLEDGLHGFLPHQLKYEKGKLECSLKHSTMPCKTPMGFADISYIASHRQQGKHLKEVLFDFCSEEWSALSRLCGILNCLLPSAPKTLEDMFGFYNTFLSGWSKTVEREFNKAASEANFNRNNASLEIRPIFNSSEHGESNNLPHLKGDLYSLVNCMYSINTHPAYPCGPYLWPLCYYSCGIFAAKHNDKYLSWIVYLTETFHSLLEQLYNDCCKNCGSSTSKCRVSKCVDGCGAKAKPDNLVATHKETCNSIVHCKLMRPTLFKYGFVYRNIRSLSGVDTVQAKRTCKDFCDALGKVINKEEKFHRALAELVYRTIPNYLLAIRFPFMTLTLALWLLSFLYLIHIMVIRLDLLHIKSHLHSPSSHRIAAQSLLAAARVNKLNRVFYLQP